jgi:HAD superfamily hydrolase (TIGR01509 family)
MPNPNVLRAVCLDLMGTLIYDPYLEALEAATGLDVATAHRFRDPSSWPDFEAGRIDEAEFVHRFFRNGDQDRPLDLAAFHRVRRRGYRFLPGMVALLDALEGRLDRFVASNYPIWIEELRETFGLDRRCEGVWASCHLGVRKPDPEFYRLLLDRIGHPPEACLFVDDRTVNCTAAEEAGMRAHHFDGVDGLVERLRSEGVDVHLGSGDDECEDCEVDRPR